MIRHIITPAPPPNISPCSSLRHRQRRHASIIFARHFYARFFFIASFYFRRFSPPTLSLLAIFTPFCRQLDFHASHWLMPPP
jgi:hypothetical protein